MIAPRSLLLYSNCHSSLLQHYKVLFRDFIPISHPLCPPWYNFTFGPTSPLLNGLPYSPQNIIFYKQKHINIFFISSRLSLFAYLDHQCQYVSYPAEIKNNFSNALATYSSKLNPTIFTRGNFGRMFAGGVSCRWRVCCTHTRHAPFLWRITGWVI